MAHEFSMLSIMNAALLAQGCEEILSENDGSDEWRTLFRNWPGIVEAELEDGAYHFTRQQAHLVTRADGKFGFDDAYLIPAAALHVRQVWLLENGERYAADWLQDDKYVHLNNADGCYIEYLISTEPNLWSANFTRGIQKRCEALLSRALKEEYNDAAALDQEAEAFFQRARTISSKSRSARPMYLKGPIASARRNGRG